MTWCACNCILEFFKNKNNLSDKKERKGKERKGKERKRKERKEKERKGNEKKGKWADDY